MVALRRKKTQQQIWGVINNLGVVERGIAVVGPAGQAAIYGSCGVAWCRVWLLCYFCILGPGWLRALLGGHCGGRQHRGGEQLGQSWSKCPLASQLSWSGNGANVTPFWYAKLLISIFWYLDIYIFYMYRCIGTIGAAPFFSFLSAPMLLTVVNSS